MLELISPNKTASTSKEEENMLWDKKILGTSNPLMLQRAVFFSVGKVFCLRGGEDQRELKPSQLIRKSKPDRYVYVETGSNNQTGGLKQLDAENKVVHVYAPPADGERCLVYLYFYLNNYRQLRLKKIFCICNQRIRFLMIQHHHDIIVSQLENTS